jgi:hypothetical protein
LGFAFCGFFKEPIIYEEAVNCQQKVDENKWKNAINKKEIEKRGMWEVIDEKKIPINSQCIKNKWIFK